MIGKKNDSTETPTDRTGPAANDRQLGGDPQSGQTSSRLSSAIMRILATARGATEGRRAITPADLQPPRLHGQADAQGHKEEEILDGDSASKVEWSLRMMQ